MPPIPRDNARGKALGAALTHPDITTDYSESLIEFITPPLPRVGDALQYLADLQAFVYRRLDNEILWSTSMPCVLSGDQNIPVAEYGNSNAGRMKHLYRVGLGYRYGRVMQVIAGIHFNFSLPDAFWGAVQGVDGLGVQDATESRNAGYMGMVRQWQEFFYDGRYSHSYVDALPDFKMLAESFGHVGMRIDKPADLEDAYREAFGMKDRVVFMDIIVDPSENVYPMIEAGKGHHEMHLSPTRKSKGVA